MLSPLEQLARATARGIPFGSDYLPGGPPALTAAEIAGALAGTSRGSELLIREIALDDHSVRDELVTLMRARFSHRCLEWRGFSIVRHGYILERMCRIAIDRIVDPMLCRDCSGRGERHRRGGVVEVCRRCGGSGNGSASQAYTARLCGVSRDRWGRTWASRYGEIELVLDCWLHAGIAQVAKNLRRE